MKLNEFDLEKAVRLLPETVRNVVMTHNITVAGGFLRCVVNKERIKDIDIFSPTKEQALAAHKDLLERNAGKEVKIVETKNAISIRNVEGRFVQFITRWSYPDPETLLNSFDFTIARAAIWYDKDKGIWDSLIDENFYADVAAKRLNFLAPVRQEDPAGSLLRVLKFVKKGYNIPSKSLAGVVARVAKAAERQSIDSRNPYSFLAAPYGQEAEDRWVTIIHTSIRNVTGES